MRHGLHIQILPDRKIVAINMETGDEASVAKTINARSGQVYNCDDKLAKELDMFLLRSAYFLAQLKLKR